VPVEDQPGASTRVEEEAAPSEWPSSKRPSRNVADSRGRLARVSKAQWGPPGVTPATHESRRRRRLHDFPLIADSWRWIARPEGRQFAKRRA